MKSGSFLIGLAGGSASGKTTLIRKLQSSFLPDELCVVSLDHYYKPLSAQQKDDSGRVNFDQPEALDFDRLKKDLQSLKKGRQIQIVEYTFNNPAKFPRSLTLKPAPIILIEGLFVYNYSWLNRQLNWKLFIHAESEVAYSRRMIRDVKERGMKRKEVEYQWKYHVLPAFEKYLKPHLSGVHFRIDNSDNFESDLEQVRLKLREYLDSGSSR